jgi:hypothetical protein
VAEVESTDEQLEGQIAEWRAYLRRRPEVTDADAEELEDHLRSTITELRTAGLRPDEAFLISVKRLGGTDEISREFAREHSDRLWKQLVLAGDEAAPSAPRSYRDLIQVVVCVAIAVVGVKLPNLFGFDMNDSFYARNLGILALAPLAIFFAWRRRVSPRVIAVLVGLFALGAVGANVYPYDDGSQSIVLSAIHLPLALWFVVGIAYVSGDWRSDRARMDFIRFTGEAFIYYVLIGLGGGVLTALTYNIFNAIGLDVETFVSEWLLPCGAVGALVVAAWLVESKQSVIENMAPVLTRVFTPLFTAVLVAVIVAAIATFSGVKADRDVLILFDVLLVVVLGLLLYSISARDPLAPPNIFDRLQFLLVIAALVVDALVLVAITGRISEFGFTPNKSAALGENVILLANLAFSAWLLLEFTRHRGPFARLERWQTGYLSVFALWAWIVVLVFPPIFNFA